MKLTSQDDDVLVTGGASGLGAATVRPGWPRERQVMIMDLPSSPGAELAAGLGDAGALRRRRRPRRGAGPGRHRRGGESWHRCRVAVNCAGVATPGRVIGKRGVLVVGSLPDRDRDQPGRDVQRAAAGRRSP